MKATKYTVKITAKALSVDSIPGLLMKVAGELRAECAKGTLQMDDGDKVKWTTSQKPTEI